MRAAALTAVEAVPLMAAVPELARAGARRAANSSRAVSCRRPTAAAARGSTRAVRWCAVCTRAEGHRWVWGEGGGGWGWQCWTPHIAAACAVTQVTGALPANAPAAAPRRRRSSCRGWRQAPWSRCMLACAGLACRMGARANAGGVSWGGVVGARRRVCDDQARQATSCARRQQSACSSSRCMQAPVTGCT
jgi:hypothetical protein